MSSKVFDRWKSQSLPNPKLTLVQRKFRFYKYNIFILNHVTT